MRGKFGSTRTAGRRAAVGLAALLLTVLLAGCSGGGGGTGSALPAPVPVPAPPPVIVSNWATGGVTFNSTLAQQILNSPEFKAANANCAYYGCAASGPLAGNQSQAYELHDLQDALSSGVSGAGKLVAVVDVGFRPTHQEFSGKSIQRYGTLPLDDHGTHVAALIAGVRDGRGMFGVAPDASLHLTALNPAGGTIFDLANVTGGTLDAAAKGAVAQNNSWGFDIAATAMQSHLAAHPGESVAQALNGVVANYGAGNWQAYLDALRGFENKGVIVWALSNTATMTSGDVMATLPYFDTRLQGAWITAGNAYFETDGNGRITSAVRLSAACGLAARFCLMGDGTTTAADASSDTGYSAGTGSSYVAPQVAGAVALLSQAFPDLTPAEWTKRLLASADNSFFSAQGIATSGIVDFGNGVTHAYSNEWGQGVLDIAAALRPIGAVSMLSGDNVLTSERASLADSAVVLPQAFGDGLKSALDGSNIAVFDALNRGYAIKGSALVGTQTVTLLPQLMAKVGPARWGELPSYQTLLANEPPGERGTSVALVSTMGGVLETASIAPAAAQASVLSMVHDGVAMTTSGRAGLLEVAAAGFAGSAGSGAQDMAAGAGINLALGTPASRVSLGLSYLGEQGGLLGLGSGTAFSLGDASTVGTLHLGVDQRIADGMGVFGRLEYGMARPGSIGTGLVASVDDVRFSGFALGASFNNVMAVDDAFSVSVAQPLRVESGTARFNLPSARSADGQIEHRSVSAGLAPAGRQVDFGIGYKTAIGTGQLQLGLQYSIDAGHIRGASAIGGAVGLQQAF